MTSDRPKSDIVAFLAGFDDEEARAAGRAFLAEEPPPRCFGLPSFEHPEAVPQSPRPFVARILERGGQASPEAANVLHGVYESFLGSDVESGEGDYSLWRSFLRVSVPGLEETLVLRAVATPGASSAELLSTVLAEVASDETDDSCTALVGRIATLIREVSAADEKAGEVMRLKFQRRDDRYIMDQLEMARPTLERKLGIIHAHLRQGA